MLFKIKIWYNYINAANNILAAGLAVSACGESPLGVSVKQKPEVRKVALAA